MGMGSEWASEVIVEAISGEIKKEIANHKRNTKAVAALKKVGRFTLTQLDSYGPVPWLAEYEKLFKDESGR